MWLVDPFIDFFVYGALWLYATLKCLVLGTLIFVPLTYLMDRYGVFSYKPKP